MKCRQNATNELFITHDFNSIHPYTCNSYSATCSTERSHMSTKVEASYFCGDTECTYNTVVVDVGPVGSVGCGARVPSIAWL